MNDEARGRALGLIGGLGVGATVLYYKELVKAHIARAHVPNLVVIHADVHRVLAYAARQDISGMAQYLADLISRLQAGGAELAAIPAITPHMCVPELRALSPIPLIDILDEIAADLRTRKLRRIALFGTRFTIESKLFGALPGIEIIAPAPDEIDLIHSTYLQLVNDGVGSDRQYQDLRCLAHTLCERERLDAILLAGTELSLVFDGGNTDFPHINATDLHLKAIMRELFP